jgi:hypothetical protein
MSLSGIAHVIATHRFKVILVLLIVVSGLVLVSGLNLESFQSQDSITRPWDPAAYSSSTAELPLLSESECVHRANVRFPMDPVRGSSVL